MSGRQSILTQVKTDLPFITTANGYAVSLSDRIYRGFLSSAQINNYPTCFYLFLGENAGDRNENDGVIEQEAELAIAVRISVQSDPANSGLLTDEVEKYIDSFKKWVHQDTSINQAKTFRHDLIKPIQHVWIKNIEPYLDFVENKTTIGITIGIIYIDAYR